MEVRCQCLSEEWSSEGLVALHLAERALVSGRTNRTRLECIIEIYHS